MPFLRTITPIIAGLVLFIYGLRLVNRSLLSLTGPYFRVGLGMLAGNRFGAFAVGTGLSFLLSSSGATTVLLVGMGSAGFLSLRQALSVVLGAAVGATLTVQIIAFNFGDWAAYIVAVGFLVSVIGRYRRTRQVGGALFGFGLLFFGIALMRSGVKQAVGPEEFEGLRGALSALAQNRFYLFLLAIPITAVCQSSATTLAIAFAFGVPLEGAVAMALGAGVGTTAAGVVAGLRDGRPLAKQIGLGHFLVKLIAASFFMAVLPGFVEGVVSLSARLGMTAPDRVIANANTLFTLITGAFFLLALPALEQAVIAVAGEPEMRTPTEGLSYADLDEPEAAVGKAHRQVVAMGRRSLEMLRKNMSAFLVGAHRTTDEILAGEDELDTWDAVLSDFLGRIKESDLSAEANDVRGRLRYVIKDVEHIGDVLSTELVDLAGKKTRRGVDFSMEGAHHFEKMHRLVADDLSETLDLLEGLPADPQRVLENASRLDSMRRSISRAHMRRVAQGVVADVETSRIFLDAVAALRNIHFYVSDIVQVLAAREST